jgi:DNA-binding winged helix-turn-helix (wHTH) protein/tetratricopeptide (TPR) repeat protein
MIGLFTVSQSFSLPDRSVDLDTGRISTGGELRPMELRLLRYLLQRRGEVVAHEELLAHVWGYASSARTRTVYSTWHRLRAALEVDPKNPRHFLTVAGEGVSLVGQAEIRQGHTNLQQPPEGLLGREAELDWLASCGARLVTVTGPGGVGKTRLVWEHALRQAEQASWFCGIEDLDTPAAVAQRIVQVLGLDLPSAQATRELGAALGRRGPTTIILDNAESIEGPLAQTLTSWLEQAPQLRFLLTSREPLRWGGEQRLPLEPLPPSTARELLLARVRMADPRFDPAEEIGSQGPTKERPVGRQAGEHGFPEGKHEDDALDQLVELLDGLPLALEIVAPHVAAIGAASVRDTLLELGSLPHVRRDVPDRHRSLAAVVQWSIERLPAASSAALRQLAVFRRHFSLEVAERIVALPLGSPRLHELVTELVERGLVYRVPGASTPRFALYATVKAYLGPPEPAVLARYVGTWAERVDAWYATAGGLVPDDIDPTEDVDELAHAASLAPTHGAGAPTDALIELALRCLIRAGRDALPLADALLASQCSERAKARILVWKAPRLVNMGSLDHGFALWEGAGEVALREGLPQLACWAELGRAGCLFNRGEHVQAAEAADRAAAHLREVGEPSSPVYCHLEGRLMSMRGLMHPAPLQGIALLRQAVVQLARSGQRLELGVARHDLASRLSIGGEDTEAEQHVLAALAAHPPQAKRARVHAFCQLAQIRCSLRDFEGASQALREAEALVDRHYLTSALSRVLFEQARLAEAQGRGEEAREQAARSEKEARRYGLRRVELMARVAVVRNEVKAGQEPGYPQLGSLFEQALSQQMWGSATNLLQVHVFLWLRDEGAPEGAPDPLPWAERLLEEAGTAAPSAWLVRLELLRLAGRAMEGVHGLQAVAEACLPARARRVRLARAATLAEHGHLQDALLLLDREPRPTHPWEQVWRARCEAAVGRSPTRPQPRWFDPFDVLLARALEE